MAKINKRKIIIWLYYISLIYEKLLEVICVWTGGLNPTQPSDSATLVYTLFPLCWMTISYFILTTHYSLTNSYSSTLTLSSWLCLLFLLHHENGTSQKLTSKSSHSHKCLIHTYLPLRPYAIYTFFWYCISCLVSGPRSILTLVH